MGRALVGCLGKEIRRANFSQITFLNRYIQHKYHKNTAKSINKGNYVYRKVLGCLRKEIRRADRRDSPLCLSISIFFYYKRNWNEISKP